MKKYTKDELFKMDGVEVYKLVLTNRIKVFPAGFWQQPEAFQNACECITFLFEHLLEFSDDEIKKNLSHKLFSENKLGGMLRVCFNASPYQAINAAYPGKFKPWEFNITLRSYWENIENGVEATRWLFEEKLNLSHEEIKKDISKKIFKDNGLGGMLKYCFNNSPYQAINTAYPGKFKPWEFNCAPRSYWGNIENGIEATRWLFEEKLKLSDEEIKAQLSYKLFVDNGLGGMFQECFDSSPYQAINAAYPGKFKPWEFNITLRSYWENIENGVEATRWLFEEKLKLSHEEIKAQLSYKLFDDNGLRNMLFSCFNDSLYQAINAAYPGKFKPWELNCVPRGYWGNIENGIEATRWLFEEKLKLSDEEIKSQISRKLFEDNGLDGMLQQCFSGSPSKALNSVYPDILSGSL